MIKFEITPQKTAMLVIDMVKAYFTPGSRLYLPTAQEILPRLNKLLRVCRAKGVPVIYARPVHQPDGSDSGLLNVFHPLPEKALTREERMRQEEEMEIYSGIKPEEGDLIVGKPRFSAFPGTELDLILRGKGADTLIIGGVATNTCCRATAQDAYTLDYKVIFLSDGSGARELSDPKWGSYTAEEVQRFVLATLAWGWAQVSSIDEVIAELEPGEE